MKQSQLPHLRLRPPPPVSVARGAGAVHAGRELRPVLHARQRPAQRDRRLSARRGAAGRRHARLRSRVRRLAPSRPARHLVRDPQPGGLPRSRRAAGHRPGRRLARPPTTGRSTSGCRSTTAFSARSSSRRATPSGRPRRSAGSATPADGPGDRHVGAVHARQPRSLHPIYEACEEFGLPFNIHVGGAETGINRGSYAVGAPTTFMEYHTGMCVPAIQHLISWISEGIPVKFPNVKLVLNEFGVAWLPWVMWRMDTEWRAAKDVPWLTRRPSEYIRESVRFTTQPLEEPEDPKDLVRLLELVHGDEILIFSSDYPHWDADDPDSAGFRPFPEDGSQDLLGQPAQALRASSTGWFHRLPCQRCRLACPARRPAQSRSPRRERRIARTPCGVSERRAAGWPRRFFVLDGERLSWSTTGEPCTLCSIAARTDRPSSPMG